MQYKEGQLIRFGRVPNEQAHEVAQVLQVDSDDEGAQVAIWVSSPYQETEPVKIKVKDLALVEELAELPPLPGRRHAKG